MPFRNSHPNSEESCQPSTDLNSKPPGLFKGWIDLEKNHKNFVPLLALLLLAAAVFGAQSYLSEPITDHSIQASRSNSITGIPNPVFGDQPHYLSREYLYAETDLIAIEDAGATSAPTSDLAIWRPSTGTWWTKAGLGSKQVTVQWGIASDRPAIGDYDGDGKTDFCVFRSSEGRWYIIQSSSDDETTLHVTFGQEGDIPAQSDYDGDGKTDFAIWRPSNGSWHIKRSSDGKISQFLLGASEDKPSPADFDGDGKADAAVWRSSTKTFYSINSSDGLLTFTNMGGAGSPVPGDYDGDGSDDFAIRNGSEWRILKSSENRILIVPWQAASDFAVHNDYDGDGVTDIATWRPAGGLWLIRQSSNGLTRTEEWGIRGDIPLPALYKR